MKAPAKGEKGGKREENLVLIEKCHSWYLLWLALNENEKLLFLFGINLKWENNEKYMEIGQHRSVCQSTRHTYSINIYCEAERDNF